MAHGAAALLYQGDGDQDPLAEEDEHADHHQEDDPGDGGEGHPRVALLEEVLRDGWCPVQLRKNIFNILGRGSKIAFCHLKDVLHGLWISVKVCKVEFVSTEAE